MSAIEDFLDKVNWEGLDYAALEWEFPGLEDENLTLYGYIQDYRKSLKRLQDFVDSLETE